MKLLVTMTMLSVKDNNYIKFKANYIKDRLHLVKFKDYHIS